MLICLPKSGSSYPWWQTNPASQRPGSKANVRPTGNPVAHDISPIQTTMKTMAYNFLAPTRPLGQVVDLRPGFSRLHNQFMVYPWHTVLKPL
jgi:hypothetical protein